jgi:hypothetical protein
VHGEKIFSKIFTSPKSFFYDCLSFEKSGLIVFRWSAYMSLLFIKTIMASLKPCTVKMESKVMIANFFMVK